MLTHTHRALLAVSLLVPLTACAGEDALMKQANTHFKPLPAAVAPASMAKVELGRKLFHETKLSRAGNLSCASCHGIETFGVDRQPTSTGFKDQKGDRNSPTVLNASLHMAQFWDGRAGTLADQAKGPILNPVEMAMASEADAVKAIQAVESYKADFKAAFPDAKEPITYDNIATAIASFEETLVTPSRFDRFLAGDGKALTAEERDGLQLFVDKGCVSCHAGVAVGGQMYQKVGLVSPYENTKDLGRFNVTKNEADKYVFKVPSLRNITQTYPYFHDGKVAKLEDAVRVMGKIQLGADLKDTEVKAITAFLGALEGEITPEMKKLPQVSAK